MSKNNSKNIRHRLLPKPENSQDVQQGLSLHQEVVSLSDMYPLKGWEVHPHGVSTSYEQAAVWSLLHGDLTPVLIIPTQYGNIIFFQPL